MACAAALVVLVSVLGVGAGTAGAAPVSVVIEHYAFGTSQLSVTVGDTVTWTNNDTAGHDVTSVGSGPLKSPLLSKGQSFSQTFAAAGTFRYTCTVHPDMAGSVVVKAAATPTSLAPTTSPAPAKPSTAASATTPAIIDAGPTNVAAAVGPVGATGLDLSTDGSGSRLNPLLFIAAVVVAVVVGATIAVLEPDRRRRGGP